MEWSTALPWIGVVVLLCLVLPLAWWYARRSWLARPGGLFACELNTGDAERPRWVLGLARYSGEHLEWFRALSLGLRPTHTFRRSGTTARSCGSSKDPETLGGEVIRLDVVSAGRAEAWELAMDADSATGLLAWLEAAPPSVDRFKA